MVTPLEFALLCLLGIVCASTGWLYIIKLESNEYGDYWFNKHEELLKEQRQSKELEQIESDIDNYINNISYK